VTPKTHGLGPLEMQVLGLLDAKAPLTVAELQARLSVGGDELAYTTVMTVLTRLHKKGLAARSKEKNRYVYTAAAGAEGVSGGILGRIRRALFQGDRTRPILALLDDEDFSDDELKSLREAIDERLRGRG